MVTRADFLELKDSTEKGFTDMKLEFLNMRMETKDMLSILSKEMRDNKVEQTRWLLGSVFTIIGFLSALMFVVFRPH